MFSTDSIQETSSDVLMPRHAPQITHNAMPVLVILVYGTLIRDYAFILSKAYKPAQLLETAPVRGKMHYAVICNHYRGVAT